MHANGHSAMFCCDEPSHHQRRHQHYVRYHDHSHPNANLSQVPAPTEAQGRPRWRFCIGFLHRKPQPHTNQPETQTHTAQILSAILNKFYSFNEPFGSNWTFWYIRESSTAIITANLPYIWTLLRRIFKLGSFSGSTYGKSTNNPSKAYRSNFTNHRSVVRSQVRAEHNLHQVDSEEEINATYALPLKIYAKHEIQITSEDAGPEDRRGPVGCIPDELMSHSKDSIRTDDVETNSERSAAGVVKVYHGV